MVFEKNIHDFYDVSKLFESSQNTQIKNTTSSNFYTHKHTIDEIITLIINNNIVNNNNNNTFR